MTVATCSYCAKQYKQRRNTLGIYCSNNCCGNHKRILNVANWLSGAHKGWTGKTRQLSDFVRQYLHMTRGTACEECGWDKRHPIDGAILTEIDHIDGDAENCRPSNLKIVCPNCHSMTPTFRSRNKSSSRNR